MQVEVGAEPQDIPRKKSRLTNQNGRRVAGQLSIPKQVRAEINLKSSRVRGVLD